MHDIDRTQLEFNQEMPGFQSEQFEYGEAEWSGESVLSEADEIQLAGELLEVTNEAELDRFLGDFIKKVGSVAGQVIRSPVGQAVGGVLKGVAKKALPSPAAPSAATSAARWARRSAADWRRPPAARWGLEAEQLEQEDREFEGAKQFVQRRRRYREGRRRRAPGLGSACDRPGCGDGRGEEVRSGPARPGRRRGDGRGRTRQQRPLAASRQQDRPLRRVGGDGDQSLRRVDACRRRRAPCSADWRASDPFALLEPMLPAANLLPGTQDAIERHLVVGRRQLRKAVRDFLAWLARAGGKTGDGGPGPASLHVPQAEVQCRDHAVRPLQRRHHAAQRERDGRVAVGARRRLGRRAGAARRLLRGAAGDLLPRPRHRRRHPAGAHAPAGRRREPGGDHPRPARAHGRQRHRLLADPRGRAPGRGAARPGELAASGAAGAAARARQRARRRGSCGSAGSPRSSPISGRWRGSASPSTMGLMGVVSLPRAFVFRLNVDDPHPMPWIRVKLSCAMGDALYPHPQWARLADLWESLYPIDALDPERQRAAGAAAGQHAGLRHAARQPSAEGAARTLAGRGAGRVVTPAGAADRAVPRLEPRTRPDVPRLADAGVRRARPGRAPTASSRRKTKARCSPSCSRTGRCAARSMPRSALRAVPRPRQIPRAAWLHREDRLTIH